MHFLNKPSSECVYQTLRPPAFVRNTFLHRINTSGVKIRLVLKKFMIYIL